MISDFIKGKRKFDFPPRIQSGISLHRQIDSYTDDHPATREAVAWLKPAAGRYAGAFLDVAYDYFLANDSEIFPESRLELFVQETYALLNGRNSWFPPPSVKFFAAMEKQNWLLHYRSEEGIRRSFEGLVYRARYIKDSGPVFDAFIRHREVLRNHYDLFIPQLKAFAYNEFLYLR